MRGTKLLAWRVPAVWQDLQTENVRAPENSEVLKKQKALRTATEAVLLSIFKDVRGGLLETVGIDCGLAIGEFATVILLLPESADADLVARAVDAENVEAWRDAENRVHVGIAPWLSTKDVDQTVLAVIKVIHVLLGLHATDNVKPLTITEKILTGISEIITLQKSIK